VEKSSTFPRYACQTTFSFLCHSDGSQIQPEFLQMEQQIEAKKVTQKEISPLRKLTGEFAKKLNEIEKLSIKIAKLETQKSVAKTEAEALQVKIKNHKV
jgi:hypothetical protein